MAILLLAGLSSCFYTDSDMYFVEPVADDPPVFSVGTNLDTLLYPEVFDSLEVEYIAEITGGEFYYFYARLAGSVVFESDSTLGSFWITSFMADSAGIDTLYMNFYYSTNTNSLGDKFGYEALVEELKYAIDFKPGGKK